MCAALHRVLMLAAIAVAAILSQGTCARAGEVRCAHCGCVDGCQKVCRLVVEEKKVEVICWGSKCEDFCLRGPSTPGCRNCEEVCDSDDAGKSDRICSHAKRFVWTEWCPGWATVHTKKKLMKRVVTKKVPSHKWVVEDLCDQCAGKSAALEDASSSQIIPVSVTTGDWVAPVVPSATYNADSQTWLR